MSTWQQHYYTWSTKSLSQNKVGLGIVAASKDDRDTLLTIGNLAGKCRAVREEEGLTAERFCYSPDLPGYVRMGTTACEQGADQRNNQFVHVYSLETKEDLPPEVYFTPLSFEKNWDGRGTLKEVTRNDKETGRKTAVKILREFGLEKRISELFFMVYRSTLGGAGPLSIIDPGLKPEEYGEFARKMMIVIHYMLPVFWRKEADYISCDDGYGARFLFGKERGNAVFYTDRNENKKTEYGFLEEEYYQRLSRAFFLEDDTFETYMKQLEDFLSRLKDKRNLLEKAIFAMMADEKEIEKKEGFYPAASSLMYWARKEEVLVPVLVKAVENLDFHSMKEENLMDYTGMLLMGAGGATEDMVISQLSRMLIYYHEKKDARFHKVLHKTRESKTAYLGMLRFSWGHSMIQKILFAPLKTEKELKESYQLHSSFFDDHTFRRHFVSCAYQAYCKAEGKQERKSIERMGKSADEVLFVKLKLADVEKVFSFAKDVRHFFAISREVQLEELESPILDCIYRILKNLWKENDPEQELIEELLFCIRRLKKEGALAEAYVRWLEKNKEKELDPERWIGFVCSLSDLLQKSDTKKAKQLIQVTKKQVLSKEDTGYLNQVNEVLRKHDAPAIPIPKEWIREAGNEESPMKDRIREILQNIIEDITSGTVWGLLLGLFGFLFITLREIGKIRLGYHFSIVILIILVLGYLLFQFGGRREVSPGALLYVLGTGVFLMNLGLSFDTIKAAAILYTVVGAVSIVLKIVYHIFLENESEEDED